MRWRDIPVELVEQTARVPEWEEASLSGRINRWKRVENKFLRVTVREEAERIVVITVALKRDRTCRREDRVRIEYDPEADALYIQLRQAQVEDNIDIEDGVSVDLDGDKHIIGIEVLDASKRLSATDLSSISIERFPVETTVP